MGFCPLWHPILFNLSLNNLNPKRNQLELQSTQTDDAVPVPVDPMQFLESDREDDSTMSTVRVKDKGSKLQTAVVDVQGVQTEGIIDTGADITIMGPELFKMVAAVAHLKKSHLKPPAKVPYTYD